LGNVTENKPEAIQNEPDEEDEEQPHKVLTLEQPTSSLLSSPNWKNSEGVA
jgi:hypothetical protein